MQAIDIIKIIAHRYPNAQPGLDFDATDTETGGVISFWKAELGPQPTPEQLQSWWLDAAKYHKRRELRIAQGGAHREIFEVDGTFIEADRDHLMRRELKTLIPTPGTPTLSTSEQTKLQRMDDVRAQLQQRLNDVANATDVPGVEAVSW